MASRRKKKTSSVSGRILYWGSHLLFGIVVLFIFLTLVQCTIKKPEAPSWNIDLTVPLANRTWTMPQLISKLDQDNLTTDSAGNPLFYYHELLDTVEISGSFAIDDVSQSVAESLGVITLDPMSESGFTIALADQFPAFLPGLFPDTSFDIIDTLPPFDNFSTATISSGFAQMTVNNDFGLDFDTVIVTINDLVGSQEVTTYSIPGGIAAGDQAVDTIDLSGETISNQLIVVLHCHAVEQTLLSLADKSLASAVGMPEGLSVSAATAKIPEITKSFGANVEISSEHQLETAQLLDGQLVLNISNNTNVDVQVQIVMPDITLDGSPFEFIQDITTQTSDQFIYDLTGYSLEPSDQTMPQALDIEMEATIASSGEVLVDIAAGDDISVAVGTEDIALGTVTGIIGATEASFDGIQEEIDVPTGFDAVHLPSATLVLEIENTVNVPGTFSISLDGDQGQHKVIAGDITPGTPDDPVITIVTDTTVGDFLNPIPELFTMSGSAVFGDGVSSGSVSPGDYVLATVTLSSPLDIIIDSSTVDGGWDDTRVEIDSAIVNSFKVANFYATFENHLPVGVSAEILFAGDSASLYVNPEVTLGPVTVPAGEVDGTGQVTAATIVENILLMDSIMVQVLHYDTLWIGERITLHGTGGNTVVVSASDYLTLTGYIELDATVSENLWED